MYPIPEQFAHFMHTLHGDAGRDWLNRLPAILDERARQWDLTIGPPFPNLTYHYVAPATRADGAPVVLKACSPTREFPLEAEAMRIFAGHGMAQLIAADDANEVLLLERLTPGTTLLTLDDDDAAMRIAASVMRALWRPVPPHASLPDDLGLACGLRALAGAI